MSGLWTRKRRIGTTALVVIIALTAYLVASISWYSYNVNPLEEVADAKDAGNELRTPATGDNVLHPAEENQLFQDNPGPGNSNHTSPHLEERGIFDGRNLKKAYKEYKKKGRELRCVLDGQKTSSTPWTDYAKIEEWGWRLKQKEVDYEYVQKRCTGVDIGDLSAGIEMEWLHSEGVQKNEDGKNVFYYATNAAYTNVFFPAAGVLMANVNYGPAYKASHDEASKTPWPEDAPLPKLKQWSDVAFLTWVNLASADQVKNLRWVFRRIIRNDDTQNVIGHICKQKKVGQERPKNGMGPSWQAPVWPGLVVRPSSASDREEVNHFNALLGTPNANGIVWLLAQHREQLGQKTVKSIRVWSDSPQGPLYSPSMLLEIGDADEAGQGEQH